MINRNENSKLDLEKLKTLFSNNKLYLPIKKYEGDFAEFLKNHLDFYFSEVEKLSILDTSELVILKMLISKLKSLMKNWYLGKTSTAYDNLNDGLKSIKDYLIIRNFSYKEIPFFFRFRVGNNYDYSINDLFHIPYSKRTLVNNYRYSIAGHPSLYLGHSTFVCWNEMRKPDFNTVHVQRYKFRDEKPLKLIDFGYRPQDIIYFISNIDNNDIICDIKDFNEYFLKYIFTYPIILCCSVRVKEENANFKPEYIIPQLVLQYAMKNTENLNGVRYFSVSTDFPDIPSKDEYGLYNQVNFIHNFALPAKVINKENDDYCSELSSLFIATKPVNWINLSNIDLSQVSTYDEYGLKYYAKSSVQIIRDKNYPYKNSKFGEIEAFLMKDSYFKIGVDYETKNK